MVYKVANCFDLEISPQDMGELLGSHVLELTNEDLLGNGEGRVVDEEVTTWTPPRLSAFTIRRFSEMLKGIKSV
jgi:hypothetical protein